MCIYIFCFYDWLSMTTDKSRWSAWLFLYIGHPASWPVILDGCCHDLWRSLLHPETVVSTGMRVENNMARCLQRRLVRWFVSSTFFFWNIFLGYYSLFNNYGFVSSPHQRYLLGYYWIYNPTNIAGFVGPHLAETYTVHSKQDSWNGLFEKDELIPS